MVSNEVKDERALAVRRSDGPAAEWHDLSTDGSGPGRDRGTLTAISPPDRLPHYDGLNPGIRWAFREQDVQAYAERSQRFRSLQREMAQIPSLPASEFTADRWCGGVAYALLRGFGITDERPGTLEELFQVDQQHGTTFRPREMVDACLFQVAPGGRRFDSQWALVTSFDPKDVTFNAARYAADSIWPLQQRDLLGRDLQYLLVIGRGGEVLGGVPDEFGRVRIKLVPQSPEALLNDGFVRFYEELCARGIPGEMDVMGPNSVKDAYLWRYDLDFPITHVLFPQFGLDLPGPEATPKEPGGAPRGRYDTTYCNPLFETICDNESQREVTDPETGRRDDGVTAAYQELAQRFKTRGFTLDWVADRLEAIHAGKLGPGRFEKEHWEFISTAIVEYYSMRLSQGVLRHGLEGLERVLGAFRGAKFEVPPEFSDKLRMYYEAFPSQELLLKFLHCFDTAGFITADVITNFKVPPGMITVVPSNIAEEAGEDNPCYYEHHQELLEQCLIYGLSRELPGMTISSEMLYEIRYFGNILLMMRGGNSTGMEAIGPLSAVVTTLLLEHTSGTSLPELRAGLPSRAQHFLTVTAPQGEPLRLEHITSREVDTGDLHLSDAELQQREDLARAQQRAHALAGSRAVQTVGELMEEAKWQEALEALQAGRQALSDAGVSEPGALAVFERTIKQNLGQ
jgi:hypothetical protein